ncbi:hypothetical protein AB0C96_42610 [Streptomyces sp. NPDC048506]|uniref:hypothetical protein n=1 Tax=Streptomyces sp. NPDC048506 TaxID=3155028 RepID=UPI0034467CD6
MSKTVSDDTPLVGANSSVVTIQDRKVTHWRDYLDPIAVFDAQGWPQGSRP